MDYIRDHWQGRQSLAWAFWVNLVVLRAVILFFQQFTYPPFIPQSTLAVALTVAYVIGFQMIVYGWQVLGLVRACDRFSKAMGAPMATMSAQIGIAVSFVLTVIYVFGAFHALFAEPVMPAGPRFKNPVSLGEYTLTLTNDGTRVRLKGDIRIGVTKELAAILEQHPAVTAIELSSNGGRVTEGRGLARLIKKRGLDTYVFDQCKSACTTAFIGGRTRVLGAKGRLGFHQFKLETLYKNPYVDPKAQQDIELQFYRAENIDEAFLAKIYQARPTDIWSPTSKELVDADIVHKVLTDDGK